MSPVTIFDVFTYCNEAMVLDVRIRTLAPLDVVHVAVESTQTFTGNTKPLLLADDRVDSYEVPARDVCDARTMEAYQRDYARVALAQAGAMPDDLVIFGDVDEIPNPSSVQRYSQPKTIRMPYHSLLATLRRPLFTDRWNHQWPVVATVDDIDRAGGFVQLRALSTTMSYVVGGWHLSSMGGPDVVLDKIEAFAHAHESWTVGLDAARMRRLAWRKRDIADRFTQARIPVGFLPRPIQDAPDTYKPLVEVCW